MADTFSADKVAWVLRSRDLGYLCEAISEVDEVVMDLETTGLDEWAVAGGPTNGGVAARVVLASFTLPNDDTWVLPLSHPDSPWLGRWRTTLRQAALCLVDNHVALVNHNVGFDCRWVKAHAGVDLSRLVTWDTQISSHLLDENASTRLKERVPATFHVERWDDFDLTTPGAAERVPLFDLGLYAARDTYWTRQLKVAHAEVMNLGAEPVEPQTADEVEVARLGRVSTWCAMPMVATLTGIEQRGMNLDVDWTANELAEHRSEAARLTDELAGRYPVTREGPPSFAPTSHWFAEWADLAVATGDLVVAELTPTGKSRWSKGVLIRQARTGSEVASDLLELRGHVKKAEFLESWLHWVTPTGSIHTNYNAGRVVTGRLSSSDPNLQQVTAALKPAFVPSPGFLFADFDYSQIELRVAAFISRCEPMIAAFQRGDDLHRLLASRITGKRPEDVNAVERQAGKSANFGLLYMMGAWGFKEYAETVYGISFTIEEATAIHRAFFDTWDGMSAWHARTVARVRATGQVVSPLGRVRRLPQIWDGNDAVAAFAERAAVNSPVQGFASDVMQIAAASIEGLLPGSSRVRAVNLVGTVHDSVLAEVPEDDWERVVKECQERLLDVNDVLARMDCRLDVPLAVEVKVGTRWGLSDVATLT